MPVLPRLPHRIAHRIASDDSSRPLWRHPATIAAAALALTLGAVPLLPDERAEQGVIAPSAETVRRVGAAGVGEVTAEMRKEIERVVAAGAGAERAQGRTATARASVRCATFDGQRYCLGFGWTHQSRADLAARLETPPTFGQQAERTGDLDASGVLARTSARSATARADAERAELTMAAQSVGKVWMLRHEIQGVALPDDFAEKHPEVTTATDAGIDARGGFGQSYPTKDKILTSKVAKAQNQTYWCGPATMQAIGWSAQGTRKTQGYWARRLGTTSAGTAITDMVRVINHKTDYDDAKAAGPYIVLDISDFTFKQWYRLMMRHVTDYESPVVLHPVLRKQYYPYLDDDASGHFQVGRGFDQGGSDSNRQIGFFEPWDQSRFDPSEPAIERVQWRNAYKSYRANLDHFQHNIGV